MRSEQPLLRSDEARSVLPKRGIEGDPVVVLRRGRKKKPIRDVTPAACQGALGQGTMAWRNKPINGAVMNANVRKIKDPVSLIKEQRI